MIGEIVPFIIHNKTWNFLAVLFLKAVVDSSLT